MPLHSGTAENPVPHTLPDNVNPLKFTGTQVHLPTRAYVYARGKVAGMSVSPISIGIIGVGHVGPHVANSLILQGTADEPLLCDTNESKLASEVQDLNDSVAFAPHRVSVTNCHADYERLAGCDIIVNSAGNVSLAAVSRTGELFATVDSARSFVGRLAAVGFNGFWVNISNPCDVVTAEIQRLSGLSANHVIGTGTLLDSARLRTVISLATQLAPESIQAYMIGEHGNSQIAAFSAVSIAGKPLRELASNPRYALDPQATEQAARHGGYVAYAGKQCTEYAVANAAARLVRAIVHDENVVLPASVELNGEYGQQGLYISVPCIIGADGVREVVELSLTPDEQAGFARSCDVVRANRSKLAPFSIEDSRKVPVTLPRHPQNEDELIQENS